uniref:Uncharacterized protein n=1 Tax=viral metagenome TaxID=1070528 RepID=A0A6C0HEF8_9ZZZZ
MTIDNKKKTRKTRKTKKISKRVIEMLNDPTSVWGKNPELEKFWGDLASGNKVVLIYKDKTHKYVNMPKRFTKKHQSMLSNFDEDKDVVAVLSSQMSQDAYEVYLYPKAKNNSVEYVIKHYEKYFKPILPGAKMRVPL